MKLVSYIISLIFLWSTGAMAFAPGFLQVAGGGGGTTTADPSWGGEIARAAILGDTSTTVLTTTTSAAVGGRISIAIESNFETQSISSVSDSSSNTYSRDVYKVINSTNTIEIWSAQVSTLLASSGTITITWSNPQYTNRRAIVGYIANSTGGVDSTATGGSGYGQTVSVSESTTASKTALFGAVYSTDPDMTYGSSSWSVGSVMYSGLRNFYPVHKDETSSGTKNPNGSWSAYTGWGGAWVAYK